MRKSLLFLMVCLLLPACDVMAETMLLKLAKTEVTIGTGAEAVTKDAYVVNDKELTAVAVAGSDKGMDIILVEVPIEDVDKVKGDASYVAGSFLELAIKDPDLAKKVLEMEYETTVTEDGKEVTQMTRTKVSDWEAAGSPAGRVRLPIQISGVPSELEYDSEGALTEVPK